MPISTSLTALPPSSWLTDTPSKSAIRQKFSMSGRETPVSHLDTAWVLMQSASASFRWIMRQLSRYRLMLSANAFGSSIIIPLS